VGVSYEAHFFEYLKCAINSGEVDTTCMSLNLSQNFVWRAMTQGVDGFENELPLRRNSIAV
jgi:hypothetical protein